MAHDLGKSLKSRCYAKFLLGLLFSDSFLGLPIVPKSEGNNEKNQVQNVPFTFHFPVSHLFHHTEQQKLWISGVSQLSHSFHSFHLFFCFLLGEVSSCSSLFCCLVLSRSGVYGIVSLKAPRMRMPEKRRRRRNMVENVMVTWLKYGWRYLGLERFQIAK